MNLQPIDLVWFGGAFVLSVLGVRFLIRRPIALDRPNERSLHEHVIARGGGLAVVIVVVAGAVMAVCFESEALFASSTARWAAARSTLIVAASILACVSLVDDLRSLSSRSRLLAQSAAAIALLVAAGPVRTLWLPFVGEVGLGAFAYPATFLWILGLTNAYNFMDGINGIAAFQAIVAGAGWYVAAGMVGDRFAAIIGLLLGVGMLGFLPFNFPMAKIFLGDVGSAFLGFVFAALALVIDAGEREPRVAFAAGLLVWPFVFDASFTFWRRLLRGENVLAAHRSHLYQRQVLVRATHVRVATRYALWAILCGVAAVLVVAEHRAASASAIAVTLGGALVVWAQTVQMERAR
jgi:UDP-GlcNAc:undecaprenyl-phosphate GlcNAc-1-phosphate transferase